MESELNNYFYNGTKPYPGPAISENRIELIVSLILDEIMKNDSFIMEYLVNLKEAHAYTVRHCIQVGVLSGVIGAKLGFSKVYLAELIKAGLIHDYGKAYIPSRILDKPDKLTPCEFEIIKKHPVIGYEKLQENNCFSPLILTAVLQHHERLDGSGYPYGIKKDIGLFSQIVSVADIYDALTNDRPYHTKCTAEMALDVIRADKNKYSEELIKLLADYLLHPV